MTRNRTFPITAALAALAAAPHLGGCSLVPHGVETTGSLPDRKQLAAVTPADRDCLARAMYFESNRSSEEGLLAVGTVVMNRLEAPAYPNSICGVVGQKRQFAAGVLHKPMRDREREKAQQVADAILAGERHEKVGGAMFFHTAGYTFSYRNMHYVALAGGNAFYEKRPWYDREGATPRQSLARVQLAQASQGHVSQGQVSQDRLSSAGGARWTAQATRSAVRAAQQTPLAELGPARNVCRVAAAETGRSPG
ncbi:MULTISPECIES: cell wall hydrolase [Methylobacterium]|jgi:spore germination cell wall hydrolase CwlJ-like protein|uniref:cell wall hydrolase n=2 Tax=Methylobacteriaceae TaxID=119045 RepID=UPI0008E24999|nr:MULTISPECIES: cell wall hydrolase [Methylobacterium]MBK3398881.1 cell wall hydrolase [Methylobacterium ajmalii]MBK3410992.1 cell wall hydrolase [Methylobacterium ajmalii]MBZ6414689.1 cell wall hydrolase [Methylobacterium sp.]SFE32788.1 Cell Wall Hydrolase [Methylobacterium sp. yr596]